jgi:pyruvate dehydrogenase E1 component alpha subunit
MFEHVYAEQTPHLAQQRDEFVGYHASFSDTATGEEH